MIQELKPCPCTMIEQDEDCPVGFPSILCGACEGRGVVGQDKITALAVEMVKIANDVGEAEDPFAAWETISLWQSDSEKLAAWNRRTANEAGEWVLVPQEPTDEMLDALSDGIATATGNLRNNWRSVYRRFLAAIPSPPSSQGSDQS